MDSIYTVIYIYTRRGMRLCLGGDSSGLRTIDLRFSLRFGLSWGNLSRLQLGIVILRPALAALAFAVSLQSASREGMVALGTGAIGGLGGFKGSSLLQNAMATHAIVLGQGLRVVCKATGARTILLSDLLLTGELDTCVRVELGTGALATVTWDVRGQSLVGIGFTTSSQAEGLASPVDGSLSQSISLVVATLAHAIVGIKGSLTILLVAGSQALDILDRLLDLAVTGSRGNRDGRRGRGISKSSRGSRQSGGGERRNRQGGSHRGRREHVQIDGVEGELVGHCDCGSEVRLLCDSGFPQDNT